MAKQQQRGGKRRLRPRPRTPSTTPRTSSFEDNDTEIYHGRTGETSNGGISTFVVIGTVIVVAAAVSVVLSMLTKTTTRDHVTTNDGLVEDSILKSSGSSSSSSSSLTFGSWLDLLKDTQAKMQLAASFTHPILNDSVDAVRNNKKNERRRRQSQQIFSPSSLSSLGSVLHPALQHYIQSFLTEMDGEDVGRPQKSAYDYFLRSIGEEDVNMTSWKPSLSGVVDVGPSVPSLLPFTSQRMVSYFHPVKNPLAPPWARSVKLQVLEIYDPTHIVLTTTTTVHDVPKADCFIVEDRLLLSIATNSTTTTKKNKGEHDDADDDEVSPSSLEWSSYFHLVFHKSTIFKSVISKSTTQEYVYHWTKYKDYILSFLQHRQQHGQQGKEPGSNSNSNQSLKPIGKQKKSATGGISRYPADTLLPWLTYLVGKNRPLLSLTR
jgi:hypothetical protein